MSNIQFGLMMRGQFPQGEDMGARFEEMVEQARLIDRLGFASLTKGMHYASWPLQSFNQLVFHSRMANGAAAPTRLLTGAGVANAVGLAYDAASRRLFVLRQAPPDGAGLRRGIITIFADTASGDAAPLDTIEGNMTQLDLPDGRYFSGIGFDPYTSRLMVANPGGTAADNRVLLFDYTAGAGGNVAPIRVLQGSNVSPYLVGIPFGVPAGPPDFIFRNGFQP